VFYAFPTLAGVLMHEAMPPPAPGQADTLLLGLPAQVIGGVVGALLAALVAAGAIAAFLSTSSGLVVAAAGVLSTDVLRGRVRDFRTAAVVAGLVPLAIALPTTSVDISRVVGMAFAVAASTFCPLLVLGIWWRGLTDVGAAAGILAGGGLAFAAVLPAAAGVLSPGWQMVLAQPAVFTVPLAFLTMVVVSHRTSDRVPADVSRILLRLHAPDRLGLSEDRDLGQLGPRAGMATLPRIRGGRHRR
jgi:Na+(H+)/acetate symporter ActP